MTKKKSNKSKVTKSDNKSTKLYVAAHVSFFFSKTNDAYCTMDDNQQLIKEAIKYQLEDIKNESNIVEVDEDFVLSEFLEECFFEHMNIYGCHGDSTDLEKEAGLNEYLTEDEEDYVLPAGLEVVPSDYIEFLKARERFREQKQKSVELGCADTEVIVKGKKYKLTPVD